MRSYFIPIILAASAFVCVGKDGPPKGCDDTLKLVVRGPSGERKAPEEVRIKILEVTNPVNAQSCMAELLADEVKKTQIRLVQRDLQGRLNNQQLGSTTAPQGTTSPISKPSSVLSLISEYGGVTTSTQNQTTT